MKLLPRQSLSIVFIYSFFISHVHLLDVFEHTERKYEDAAFVEVASCLCDMTGDTCDINCCCDKDCSVEDLQAFTCASAISGRKITNNNLVDWKCAHMNSTRHFDLHPFLCIQKENSPFLGYYFKDFPARKDLPSLNDLILRKIKPPQSTWHPVRDLKMSLARKLRAASQYIFGQEIEVVVTASSGTKISKLAVPINLYRGNCDLFRRVKYLEDLKSVCSIEIKKLCASQFVNDSVLSVRTFAFGDHGRLNLFSRPGEEKFLTDMNITYLCAVNVCCYLKSKFCNSSVNCSNVLPCQGDSANNGPILSEGICHRTVLEVHYEFFWRGGKISYLKIRIILGNVPVEDEKGHVPSILTQHFSVSFKYASKMNESGAQFEMLNLTTYKRSGNPGYEISHPLVGAMITDNSLELEPDQLRENGTLIKNYLFTWKKDDFGNCELSTTPVDFGVDIFSGCLLYIYPKRFRNCRELRTSVQKLQERVLRIDLLSRGGDPDFANTEDFVRVERLPELNASDEAPDPLPWRPRTAVSCSDVSHHVQLDVVYAEVRRVRGRPVFEVVGAVRKSQTTTWSIHCVRSGDCHANGSVPFPLTSAVHFIYVTSVKNRKIKRFWTPTDKLNQCREERCWEEMFFPLTSALTSDHVVQVASWILMLLLFVFPCLWLIRHQL